MLAIPNWKMIGILNSLYDSGHKIKIFTSRGTTSGIKWKRKTAVQLKSWGVKYHELIMNKPSGDIFIDDIAISPDDFIKKMRKLE